MLIKKKSTSLPRILTLGTFDIPPINSALHKGKSAILPLLNGTVMLSSASDEPKLFA